MDTRISARAGVTASVLVFALCATGCAAGAAPESGSSASASPSSTSAPSPASASPTATATAAGFSYPDTTDPTQVAIYLKYADADPSAEIIAGPAALVADRAFTIEAQCEGGGASFEVVTADADQRVLAEGRIDCAQPPAGEYTYRLPYAGPVQVNLLDAEDVERAWVRVIQP